MKRSFRLLCEKKRTRLEQAREDVEQLLQPFRGAEMVTWALGGAVKTENDERAHEVIEGLELMRLSSE